MEAACHTAANDNRTEHRLYECLQQCEAVSVPALSRMLKQDGMVITQELKKLVSKGKVEVLRPVCSRAGAVRPHAPREHYRLIRDTDEAYLWEQEYVLPQARQTTRHVTDPGETVHRRRSYHYRPERLTDLSVWRALRYAWKTGMPQLASR